MCNYFMLTCCLAKCFLFVYFSFLASPGREILYSIATCKNPKLLFVGVNKDKAHGGANLSTRAIVRCLIVILPGFNFHSTSFAFLASIIFQQEQNTIGLQEGL